MDEEADGQIFNKALLRGDASVSMRRLSRRHKARTSS
jgi:hypothetical protein